MSENEISIVVKLKVVRFVKMTKSGDFPLRVFGKNWEEFPVALLLLAQLSTQLSLLRFWRSRAFHFRLPLTIPNKSLNSTISHKFWQL